MPTTSTTVAKAGSSSRSAPIPNLQGAGRITAGIKASAASLGPLGLLPGTWTGHGFNVIWRPLHNPNSDHFLQLNLTDETLVFNSIGGLVPNRGLVQRDIEITGVRYLQQIHDGSGFPPPTGGGALHIEPGFWLNVPATTNPRGAASVVRLASIPHGSAVNAQGRSSTFAGPPSFPKLDITPFTVGHPEQPVAFAESNLKTPSVFRTAPLPAGVTQKLVNNPNTLLSATTVKQKIVRTTQLHIDTVLSAGSVVDIPFLAPNAAVDHFSARFWIETVQAHDGSTFVQLQYSQRLLLDFAGLSWPHVSVATLVLTGA